MGVPNILYFDFGKGFKRVVTEPSAMTRDPLRENQRREPGGLLLGHIYNKIGGNRRKKREGKGGGGKKKKGKKRPVRWQRNEVCIYSN